MCTAQQEVGDGREKLSVTQVIRHFAPAYVERYGAVMSLEQRRALSAILTCRTEAQGGRVFACEDCGRYRYAGYSCGHSACAQCGGAATQAWVAKQLDRLINVPYFMVTFTLPSEIRALMRRHDKVLYDGFFDVSSRCLKEQLGEEGALSTLDTGFLGIMHTWTQLLRYHPHIHYIVPGVGLSKDGALRRSRDDFLLPWEPLRDAFVKAFERLVESCGLLSECPPEVWDKDWRINIKAFGNGENAVKYLGAYVRRSAIGNSRIVALDPDNDTVTFTYLDRADGGERKQKTLSGVVFVSRYLQHVFPRKFHRLRYYGYLHSRGSARLLRLQTLTETPVVIAGSESVRLEMEDPPCPRCGKAMAFTDTFKPWLGPSAVLDAIWGVSSSQHPHAPLKIRRTGRAPPKQGANTL